MLPMIASTPTLRTYTTKTARDDVVARILPEGCAARRSIDRHLSVLRQAHVPSAEHCQRVGTLGAALAVQLKLHPHDITAAYYTGLLHDIGKAAIDPALLDAPRQLTPTEQAIVDRHAALGAAMLHGDRMLSHLSHSVEHHHDRFEHGHDIPLSASITAVVDAWDAMTMPRPYAGPMAPEMAADELDRCAGSQFDPDIVDAFLAMVERPRLKLSA